MSILPTRRHNAVVLWYEYNSNSYVIVVSLLCPPRGSDGVSVTPLHAPSMSLSLLPLIFLSIYLSTYLSNLYVCIRLFTVCVSIHLRCVSTMDPSIPKYMTSLMYLLFHTCRYPNTVWTFSFAWWMLETLSLSCTTRALMSRQKKTPSLCESTTRLSYWSMARRMQSRWWREEGHTSMDSNIPVYIYMETDRYLDTHKAQSYSCSSLPTGLH